MQHPTDLWSEGEWKVLHGMLFCNIIVLHASALAFICSSQRINPLLINCFPVHYIIIIIIMHWSQCDFECAIICNS